MTRTIMIRNVVILAVVAFTVTATIVVAQFAFRSASPTTRLAPGTVSGASACIGVSFPSRPC